MARNRRSSRRSIPRRRMFWAATTQVQTISAGTTAPVAIDPVNLLEQFEADYGADLFGFTITRIRGLIRVAYDQTEVVERHDVSFGIRVSTDNAIQVGESNAERVLLSPSGDPHADWMWVHNDTHYTSLNANGETYAQYPIEIDIKAQRRLDELGQGLYLLGATAVADFSTFANYTIGLRVLCKRP